MAGLNDLILQRADTSALDIAPLPWQANIGSAGRDLSGWIDILGRPAAAFSEAVQSAALPFEVREAHGVKSPVESIIRALRGKRTQFPTLGERLTMTAPTGEGEAPGEAALRGAALGAVSGAIDVAADPLMWVGGLKGPGAAEKAVSQVGKVLETPAAVLPTLEKAASKGSIARRLLASELKALNMKPRDLFSQLDAGNVNAWIEGQGAKYVSNVRKLGELDLDDLQTLRAYIRTLPENQRAGPGPLGALAYGLDDMSHVFARYGPAGEQIASEARLVDESARMATGRSVTKLQRAFKEAGIHNSPEERSAAFLHAGGKFKGEITPRIEKGAQAVRELLDEVPPEINAYNAGAAEGQRFKIYHPDDPNVSWDWKPLPDYIPQYYNFTGAFGQPNKRFFAAAKELAKRQGITELEAQSIIKRQAFGRPSRVGHLEVARVHDVPGFETDPYKVLPQYFEDVHHRIESAKTWGATGQKLRQGVQTAVDTAGLDADWGKRAADLLVGIRDPYTPYVDDLLSSLTSAQVIRHMGYSVISNASQSVNTAIKVGLFRMMKTAARGPFEAEAMRDFAQRSGALTHQLLADLTAVGTESWAHKFLRYTGFSKVEQWNRILAANAGKLLLEDLDVAAKTGDAKALAKMLDILPDYNVRAGLGRDQIFRGGMRISDMTQHITRPYQLPVWAQNRWMRMFLQFKNFLYKQTQFMLREVAKPAYQYLRTGGKEGDLMPLARAGLLMPIAGTLTDMTKDMARYAVSSAALFPFKGAEAFDRPVLRRKPIWQEDSPFGRALSDTMYVGGLGLMGDAFESAQRGEFLSWVVGPTISDVAKMTELAAQGKGGRLAKEAVRQTPIGTYLGGRGLNEMILELQ